MNRNGANAFRDPRNERSLLGQLGDELAVMYRGNLQASLPDGLQTLLDKLAAAEADLEGRNAGLSETR